MVPHGTAAFGMIMSDCHLIGRRSLLFELGPLIERDYGGLEPCLRLFLDYNNRQGQTVNKGGYEVLV